MRSRREPYSLEDEGRCGGEPLDHVERLINVQQGKWWTVDDVGRLDFSSWVGEGACGLVTRNTYSSLIGSLHAESPNAPVMPPSQ